MDMRMDMRMDMMIGGRPRVAGFDGLQMTVGEKWSWIKRLLPAARRIACRSRRPSVSSTSAPSY